MKKYKLLIRRYSLVRDKYITEERIIRTNDIYHEIGFIYCHSIVRIKRIYYYEIND